MSHHHVSSTHRPLGAVPVKNEKGEMTMQKVKVQRYISGRRPDYAYEKSGSSEEGESDNEIDLRSRQPLPRMTNQRGQMAFALPGQGRRTTQDSEEEEEDKDEDSDDDVRMRARKSRETKVDQKTLESDPRMRRLMQTHRQLESDDEDEDLPRRSRGEASSSHSRRPVAKPQILNSQQDSDQSEDEDGDLMRRRRREREVIDAEAIDDDEAGEDENIERRHELIKQRIAQLEIAQKQHQAAAGYDEDEDEDGDEGEEDEEESEYEEFSDSEDEIGAPRLKPIFVSKKDRITIIEKEAEEERRLAAAEAEKKLVAEERRRATMKLVEDERRREEEEEAQARAAAEEEAIIKGIAALLTDDEDDETGFELWKVRELKRIKREKEEEEARDKERAEIERLRNMTEEERQAELEANPRQITNKAEKGKYKFMQKYYHRGVFYLDEEAPVLKRDTAQPTLEDHFDKTVLPAVMQVKNFGRAGRTKYTHLVDQDTTAFDHAWGDKNNTGALKYHSSHGGGMKQVFERPGKRKKPDQ